MRLPNFLRQRSGASATEYAMLLGLIAILVLLTLWGLGQVVCDIYTDAGIDMGYVPATACSDPSGDNEPAGVSIPPIPTITGSPNQRVTTASITPTWPPGPTEGVISVSGPGNPDVSVNGGPWETSTVIQAGQSFQLSTTIGSNGSSTDYVSIDTP